MNTLTFAIETDILPDIVTKWKSVSEAAEETGYTAYWIRKLCREGALETVKKGQMFLIDPASLRKYVRRMKSLGTAKHDPRQKED